MNAWREKRKMRKISKINLTKEAKAAAELYNLFSTFFRCHVVEDLTVRCLAFYNDYHPEKGDEVITYKYKFQIIIDDKLFVYDGWCYEDDVKNVPMGIFSHWLLSNYEIYDGPSTAWYNMYVGSGNIVKKENS